MRRPRVRMILSVGASATAAALLLWFGSSRAGDDLPAESSRAPRAAATEAVTPRTPMFVPPPMPMPPEYAGLLTRSIFGRPAPAPNAADKRKKRTDPPAPEAVLVLRGVTVQANRVVALIEDTDAKQVMRVEAGGAVAGGRLTEVGFEGVQYVADGSPGRRVLIGSSLDGTAAPVLIAVPARAKVKGGEGREKGSEGRDKGGESRDGREPERKKSQEKGQSAAASSN